MYKPSWRQSCITSSPRHEPESIVPHEQSIMDCTRIKRCLIGVQCLAVFTVMLGYSETQIDYNETN